MKPGYKLTGVYLNTQQKTDLVNICKKHKRTLSGQVQHWIEQEKQTQA